MITKTVTRHFCEHCRKGYSGKKACAAHEARCWRNRQRVCPTCAEFDLAQRPLADLIAADEAGGLAAVRKLTDCPGCIVAALLASDDHWREGFNYKEECRKLYRQHSEAGYVFPLPL